MVALTELPTVAVVNPTLLVTVSDVIVQPEELVLEQTAQLQPKLQPDSQPELRQKHPVVQF